MQKNINIKGMNCGHCTSSVEKALQGLSGITNFSIDLVSKTATIDMDSNASDELLKKQ